MSEQEDNDEEDDFDATPTPRELQHPSMLASPSGRPLNVLGHVLIVFQAREMTKALLRTDGEWMLDPPNKVAEHARLRVRQRVEQGVRDRATTRAEHDSIKAVLKTLEGMMIFEHTGSVTALGRRAMGQLKSVIFGGEVTDRGLLEIIVAAPVEQAQLFHSACLSLAKRVMSARDCFAWLRLGRAISLGGLEEAATLTCIANFSNALACSLGQLCCLDVASLLAVMSSPHLNLESEAEAWHAVLSWVESDIHQRKLLLPSLMEGCVRLEELGLLQLGGLQSHPLVADNRAASALASAAYTRRMVTSINESQRPQGQGLSLSNSHQLLQSSAQPGGSELPALRLNMHSASQRASAGMGGTAGTPAAGIASGDGNGQRLVLQLQLQPPSATASAGGAGGGGSLGFGSFPTVPQISTQLGKGTHNIGQRGSSPAGGAQPPTATLTLDLSAPAPASATKSLLTGGSRGGSPFNLRQNSDLNFRSASDLNLRQGSDELSRLRERGEGQRSGSQEVKLETGLLHQTRAPVLDLSPRSQAPSASASASASLSSLLTGAVGAGGRPTAEAQAAQLAQLQLYLQVQRQAMQQQQQPQLATPATAGTAAASAAAGGVGALPASATAAALTAAAALAAAAPNAAAAAGRTTPPPLLQPQQLLAPAQHAQLLSLLANATASASQPAAATTMPASAATTIPGSTAAAVANSTIASASTPASGTQDAAGTQQAAAQLPFSSLQQPSAQQPQHAQLLSLLQNQLRPSLPTLPTLPTLPGLSQVSSAALAGTSAPATTTTPTPTLAATSSLTFAPGPAQPAQMNLLQQFVAHQQQHQAQQQQQQQQQAAATAASQQQQQTPPQQPLPAPQTDAASTFSIFPPSSTTSATANGNLTAGSQPHTAQHEQPPAYGNHTLGAHSQTAAATAAPGALPGHFPGINAGAAVEALKAFTPPPLFRELSLSLTSYGGMLQQDNATWQQTLNGTGSGGSGGQPHQHQLSRLGSSNGSLGDGSNGQGISFATNLGLPFSGSPLPPPSSFPVLPGSPLRLSLTPLPPAPLAPSYNRGTPGPEGSPPEKRSRLADMGLSL